MRAKPGTLQRGMWSWELKEILQDSLHPRWNTVWIESNRWGDRQRAAADLPSDLATLFFAKASGDYHDAVTTPFVVRRGQLPEHTILTLKESGEPDIIYLGWRNVLNGLLKQGYIRPTRKLDRALGKPSADILPPDSVWRL